MDILTLTGIIEFKKSLLCVGLDTDPDRIPEAIKSTHNNPVLEFNERIINATREYAVAYKINTAFYESRGSDGWQELKKTIDMIPKDCFIIADAKRADIGNTSRMYAKAFFETLNADAVTIAPYMGEDSVRPFLGYDGKWAILLALTSNPGSSDFQYLKLEETGGFLYETVLEKSKAWGTEHNMMYVVGATHPEDLKKIRKIIPKHFLLVPGIGTQGGDLEGVLRNGLNDNYGMLINVSRDIIYASSGEDFDIKAAERAKYYRDSISGIVWG